MIAAIILWAAFIYTTIVAVTVHLLPHILSWDLDHQLVIFLVIDAAILQFLAWLYKRLPNKPTNIAFAWMNKVSLF